MFLEILFRSLIRIKAIVKLLQKDILNFFEILINHLPTGSLLPVSKFNSNVRRLQDFLLIPLSNTNQWFDLDFPKFDCIYFVNHLFLYLFLLFVLRIAFLVFSFRARLFFEPVQLLFSSCLFLFVYFKFWNQTPLWNLYIPNSFFLHFLKDCRFLTFNISIFTRFF